MFKTNKIFLNEKFISYIYELLLVRERKKWGVKQTCLLSTTAAGKQVRNEFKKKLNFLQKNVFMYTFFSFPYVCIYRLPTITLNFSSTLLSSSVTPTSVMKYVEKSYLRSLFIYATVCFASFFVSPIIHYILNALHAVASYIRLSSTSLLLHFIEYKTIYIL